MKPPTNIVSSVRGFVTQQATSPRVPASGKTPVCQGPERRSDGTAPSDVAVELARAVAAVAATLALPDLPVAAHRSLDALLHDTARLRRGVPVSVAAGELGTTTPTVRAWINRGVLELVPGVSPKQVSVRSLGFALAAVAMIRSVGANQRLLTRIVEVLDDLQVRRELVATAAEFGDREQFDPFDVESVFA